MVIFWNEAAVVFWKQAAVIGTKLLLLECLYLAKENTLMKQHNFFRHQLQDVCEKVVDNNQ